MRDAPFPTSAADAPSATAAARLRAIHCIGSLAESAGGPSRTVTSLCKALARLGCDVDLVAACDPRRDGALVLPAADDVRVHVAGGSRRFAPGLAWSFLRTAAAAARASPARALLHDHGVWGPTNVAAWRVAARTGLPYVLSPRGMLEPWALRYKPGRKRLAWALYQQRIVRASSALVATSAQERDAIRAVAPGRPIAVIPNGVDLPAAIPDRSHRDAAADLRVLFLSRVHPKKNLPALLRAWQQVCRVPSRERWVLEIAGHDELGHTREMTGLAASLGLGTRVAFVGPVDERSRDAVLARADVFVLPSFSENFGVVVAEALAHGLPVIATRGTPWASLPERGCGWWVDASADALAAALAQALDLAPAARHAMGLAGRAYAREAFAWTPIARLTLALYAWLLGCAPRPGHVER